MVHIWKIYALLSAIFAALVAISGKIGLSKVDSTLATTIRSGVMTIFLITVSIIFAKYKTINEVSKKDLFFIIFSGISGALSWLFYFFAISKASTENIASVVAIDRLSLIFVYIFSIIIFSVEVSVNSILGVALITLGTILLNLK